MFNVVRCVFMNVIAAAYACGAGVCTELLQKNMWQFITVARSDSVLLTLPLGVPQHSLHNAPIFRLLLKVAGNGTHQSNTHTQPLTQLLALIHI